MCGRINLYTTPAELAEFFELFREPVWTRRYNVGPMQKVLVVRLNSGLLRQADAMQWGLVPGWAKDSKIGSHAFNARAETVAEKPTFRAAFKQRRCLIIADGFYEWQRLGGSSKQPWNVCRSDGRPLALAGLWESWQSPEGSVLDSCTVITTTANAFMSEIHDRMPVILEPSTWNLWMTPDEVDLPLVLQDLLIPCPDDYLMKYAVDPLVGNIRNESPDCIRRIDRPATLF